MFGFAGRVVGWRYLTSVAEGVVGGLAITFASASEAKTACAMHGQRVGDKTVEVVHVPTPMVDRVPFITSLQNESATTEASRASPSGRGNPPPPVTTASAPPTAALTEQQRALQAQLAATQNMIRQIAAYKAGMLGSGASGPTSPSGTTTTTTTTMTEKRGWRTEQQRLCDRERER